MVGDDNDNHAGGRRCYHVDSSSSSPPPRPATSSSSSRETAPSLLANSNRRAANSTRGRAAASSSRGKSGNANVTREADLLLVTSSMASASASQSQRRRDKARRERQRGAGGGGAARQGRVWDETGSIVGDEDTILTAPERKDDATAEGGRYRLEDIDGDVDEEDDDANEEVVEGGGDGNIMNPKVTMQHGLFLQTTLTNDDTTKGGRSDISIERQQQRQQKQRKQSSSKSKTSHVPQDRQLLSTTTTKSTARGNSPEINKNRITSSSSGGIPTVIVDGRTVLVDNEERQSSSTPVDNKTSPDPEFDVKSYFSRLDAPPSPGGPEKNINKIMTVHDDDDDDDDGVVPMDIIKVGEVDTKNNGTMTVGGKNDATNVTSSSSKSTTAKRSNNHSRRSPPVDPPEIGRGRDCKPTSSSTHNSAHDRTSTSSFKSKNNMQSSGSISEKKNSNITSRKNKSASSSSISRTVTAAQSASSSSSSSSLRNKASPATTIVTTTSDVMTEVPDGGSSVDGSWSVTLGRPKGILKNSGKHIPIMKFGQLVSESIINEHASVMTMDHHDDDSDDDSDPDISQRKEHRAAIVPFNHNDGNDSVTSDQSKSTFNTTRSAVSTKSGYKPGKYASLNKQFAAVNEDDDDDDDNTNNDDDDFNDVGTYESYMVGGNDGDDNSDDDDDDDDDETLDTYGTNTKNSQQRFDRTMTHFLRTTDLGLTQDTVFAEQFLDDAQMKAEPHFHHPSPHPPPGVQFNIDENWVCLDDGIQGSHSPIAPQTVDALVAMGYRAVTDPMMWTPTAKTRKYMTEKGLGFDDIPIPGPLAEGEGTSGDTASCLLWTGKFTHKYHGHDQPAVRSQGIVNMSPEDLVDLLMDSTRVNEYNKCNIGRDDEVTLSDGKNLDSCPFSGQRKKRLTGVVMRGAKVVDGTAVFDSETDDEAETDDDDEEQIFEETFDEDGTMKSSVRTFSSKRSRKPRQSKFVGVTKFVRTRNKPPLLRRVLEFFTFLHCRELTDDQGGQGYIIVARAVTPGSIDVESSKKSIMHSEILLNVYIIRRLSHNAKVSNSSSSSRRRGGSSSRSVKSVNTSRTKASKSDLSNRCLMINLHHMKCPMVPNMLAKKVGLSAASTFLTDIRNCCD